MKQSYTTGEAARLCGLGLSTIKRWLRRGALKAYKTPGGDHRILHENLLDFMRRFNIPLHPLETDGQRVLLLVVDNEDLRSLLLAAAANWGEALKTLRVTNDLDLGYMLGTAQPDFVIFEARPGEDPAARIAAVRRHLAPKPVRIGFIGSLLEAKSERQLEWRPEVMVTPAATAEEALAFLRDLFGDAILAPGLPVRRAG